MLFKRLGIYAGRRRDWNPLVCGHSRLGGVVGRWNTGRRRPSRARIEPPGPATTSKMDWTENRPAAQSGKLNWIVTATKSSRFFAADHSRMNCWRVRDQAYPNSTATKNTSAPKWTMLLITLCKASGMSNGKSPAAILQMTSVTRFVT